MATRSTHNRHDGNKGAIKIQKRFVPKTNNSTREPVANSTISTSLRRSSPRKSNDAEISIGGGGSNPSSTARVRLGENGDWASSRERGGNFVNYLPQDEAVAAGLGVEDGGLNPVESQRVVDLLNRELSRLLKLSPRDFWKEVASSTSLHHFMDSFLQFRNRWYDFPHRGAKGTVAGVIVGEFELSRRVFMLFYRISSNRDPGARASYSFSAKEHGALLQEKKLLDLPKLLDICAIFGHENEELTRLLVISAMKAQPNILENLPAVVSHFLSIAHTMHQRCSSSLEIIHPSRESNTAPLMALLCREVLFSSEGREYHGYSQLHEDFLEVMDFINDAIASMDAFINAYKQAAVYFCCPVETCYGNEELLGTLARLHDSLLPSLQRGFEQILTVQTDGFQNSLGESLPNIDTSLKMLSMRIVKFGWKLLELCYLSDGAFEGSHSLVTCAKMFPAKVEDAVIRGDILVQAFRELSLGVSHNVQETQKSRSFLQKIERNYSLLARVYSLCDNGWISMDGEQLQYLSCILVSHFLKATNKVPNVPSTSKLQMDEDAAITESKISQIKDLFPDYGKGFLSACLEVYNQNPEEVIQRILDGTLHEDLLSLDVSLEKIPPPKSVSSLSRDAKGKGALMEPPALPFTNVVAAVKDWQTDAPSSSSLTGRFTRKSKVGVPETEILDSGSKESMKTAILASQYEYEDEYDDSYDDLGMSLVEPGFEETETLGDRINSTPGKSWGAETEDSNPNTSGSRWNSRKKPQFYVKDGKNYSYKVSGSVAVSSSQEAALVNQAQKELIHGLGRGGNLPIGAVKKLIGSNEQQDHQSSNVTETERRENIPNSRGRGRRGGGGNHHRKDRAMKKHFAGSSGY